MAREENYLWIAEYTNPLMSGDTTWRQWSWTANPDNGCLEDVIRLMTSARDYYRGRSNYRWRLRNLATDEIIPGEAIEE